MNIKHLLAGICAAMLCLNTGCGSDGKQYDIVIYGGNCAGIMAAVQAKKMGKSVIVLEQLDRIGGLTTGGLGEVDHGKKSSIGGLAMEYFSRVGAKYGSDEAFFKFEPKVALEVFQDYVREFDIPVVYEELIDLQKGVEKEGNRIVAIKMESGNVYRGRMFIDASYEGDLMAVAGVSYTYGREGNAMYGETNNGIRANGADEIPYGIDPYIVPGDKSSGLLPRVNPTRGGNVGDGDKGIQAYCYRMCLTNDPENRIMVEKPEGYNELEYELMLRCMQSEEMAVWRCFKLSPMPHAKTDSNNNYGVSTDFNGGNQEYVNASHQRRAEIRKEHEIYQKGLVWTVQNHPRVPKRFKDFYAEWGLPKDEFTENGNWPQQIYIRECRRLLGEYLVTEHDCRREVLVDDPIAMGSYAMDSHHTQYFVNELGFVQPEGGFYDILKTPYPVSYRAITPKEAECANLLVPVCVSATHAAFGSIRMEPVFMMMGQAAGMAASMAIDGGTSVQKIEYPVLRKQLEAADFVLEAKPEE
ncbi:FAD-dependent oxidoreductase [Alistipes sp.]|uniref:FAD-dependent oxidoreductase n=1 Tax=Alistipes sp. TaxID=1872444 RepID=UPI003AB3A332